MNRLSGLFHKKIYSLWNRPESLFLRMVQVGLTGFDMRGDRPQGRKINF
jgi:hypothetical protein